MYIQMIALHGVRCRWQKKKRKEGRHTGLNRQSGRCLIRYLEVAKSRIIYPRARDASKGAVNVRYEGSWPNGTTPKADLTRNKSRRFINLTSLMRCLYRSFDHHGQLPLRG